MVYSWRKFLRSLAKIPLKAGRFLTDFAQALTHCLFERFAINQTEKPFRDSSPRAATQR